MRALRLCSTRSIGCIARRCRMSSGRSMATRWSVCPTRAEACEAMEEIMTGAATPAQIAAFLTALHLKGETEAEIAGMAQVMRDKATPVHFDGAVLDTCGTGGDASGTFNTSTTAAFVAAGNGATVAKHGNRAASSVCGS